MKPLIAFTLTRPADLTAKSATKPVLFATVRLSFAYAAASMLIVICKRLPERHTRLYLPGAPESCTSKYEIKIDSGRVCVDG